MTCACLTETSTYGRINCRFIFRVPQTWQGMNGAIRLEQGRAGCRNIAAPGCTPASGTVSISFFVNYLVTMEHNWPYRSRATSSIALLQHFEGVSVPFFEVGTERPDMLSPVGDIRCHQWLPQHQPKGQRHNLHREPHSIFRSFPQHKIKLLILGFLPLRKIFTICNRSESTPHIRYNNEKHWCCLRGFQKEGIHCCDSTKSWQLFLTLTSSPFCRRTKINSYIAVFKVSWTSLKR